MRIVLQLKIADVTDENRRSRELSQESGQQVGVWTGVFGPSGTGAQLKQQLSSILERVRKEVESLQEDRVYAVEIA